MDCVPSQPSCATWKTLCWSWRFVWFNSIDNYLATSPLSLKRKQNEKLWLGIKVYPSSRWFDEEREREQVNIHQSHHCQVIKSNLVIKTFTNRLTNSNHVISLNKTAPTFFIYICAQLVRPCDHRDFHDRLPQ